MTNLHLFYGADAVVFVEGGESYSVLQITEGSYTPHSHDMKFWGALFSIFCPEKRCHFRAVGSKASLVALVGYVLSRDVQRVFICADRDLDHLRADFPTDPNILHTFGYSWENCVWSRDVILAAFQKWNTSGPDTSAAEAEIDDAFSRATVRLRWFVCAHCILVLSGSSGTQIDKSLGAVTTKAGRSPRIDRGYLLKIIRAGHAALAGPVKLSSHARPDTLVDCYGHLLGRFGYQLLAYLLRKYGSIRSFPIEVATPVAIDASMTAIRSHEGRERHYAAQFARLPW
jgi:hypothetical protein